jgi:hypothetical protein
MRILGPEFLYVLVEQICGAGNLTMAMPLANTNNPFNPFQDNILGSQGITAPLKISVFEC